MAGRSESQFQFDCKLQLNPVPCWAEHPTAEHTCQAPHWEQLDGMEHPFWSCWLSTVCIGPA